MDIVTKIDEYQALCDRKDNLATAVKENNHAVEECRDELTTMMIDAEIPRISRRGFTYTLVSKTQYSKKSGMEGKLFGGLRDRGLKDVILETVNPRTLQGVMSNLAEENGGELPEEFADSINTYTYNDIQRRKETKRV
jgi:hypothetical protein